MVDLICIYPMMADTGQLKDLLIYFEREKEKKEAKQREGENFLQWLGLWNGSKLRGRN